MWNDVLTEEDVNEFLDKNKRLNGCFIISVDYEYNAAESGLNSLTVVFDSDWQKKIEVVFTDVGHFRFGELNPSTISGSIYSCYLSMHTDIPNAAPGEKIIVWSDANVAPATRSAALELERSAVFARKMKWRYVHI